MSLKNRFTSWMAKSNHLDTLKNCLFSLVVLGGYLEHSKLQGSRKNIHLLYCCFVVVFINITTVSAEVMDGYQTIKSQNIETIAQNLCVTLNFSSNIYKIVNISINRQNIKQMYHLCENLTVKYTRHPFQKQTILSNEKRIRFMTGLFFWVVIFNNFLANVLADSDRPLEYFPFRAYRPAFLPASFFVPVYRLLLLWNTVCVVAHDCTVMVLLNEIATQLMLLETNLRHLKRYRITQLFGGCVLHQQKIRQFIRIYAQTFSNIFLIQFAASMLMFALVGFQATVSPLNVTLLVYCIAILLELFLMCFLADIIIEKGKAIAPTAYFCGWYNFGTRFRRDLVIFLSHAQQPFTLKAGGLFIVSLDTFGKVLSRSYSYVALLQRIYYG